MDRLRTGHPGFARLFVLAVLAGPFCGGPTACGQDNEGDDQVIGGDEGHAGEAQALPVPEPSAVESVRARLQKIYKDAYRKRRSTARQALARELLQRAAKMKSPVTRYVLMDEARDVATRAGDLRLAWRALDSLAGRFAVDRLELQRTTLARLQRASRDAATQAELAATGLDVVDAAVLEDDYDAASAVLKLVVAAARKSKDRWLSRQAKDYRAYVKDVRQAFTDVAAARDTLKSAPDDPDAHLTVGRFECFYKGQWAAGLPHLAKSSDATLRAIAEFELADPVVYDKQYRLAESWRDQSRKSKGWAREYQESHAAHWYRKCARGLKGEAKSRAREALKKLSSRIRFHLPHRKVNRALMFDGRKDHVLVRLFAYNGENPMTVEALVKPHRVTLSGTQTVAGNLNQAGWLLGIRDGKWTFVFRVGQNWQSVESSARAIPNQTVHVAAVFTMSSLRLFVDGRPAGKTVSVGGRHLPSPYSLVLGGHVTGEAGKDVTDHFSGIIDEVRVSKTARYLTPFSAPPVIASDSDTMLLFHCDQPLKDFLRDDSGNRLNGKISGAKWVRFR